MIEFAFSIPVFLALIYYVHDIPKAKRWHSQMQFVTEQMTQIIQTISQNRTNKRITSTDLINAGKLAYLTIFPGNTLIPSKQYYYPLGYYATYAVFYVKGIEENKASVVWVKLLAADGGNSYGMYCEGVNSNSRELNRMTTKLLKNVEPSKIHSSLAIKSGEIKIIVECALVYCTSRRFGDGTLCSKKTFREVFGLLFFSPKYLPDGDFHTFFNSVVIFTPKPGLFDETPPQ